MRYLLILILTFSLHARSQETSGMVWTELGVTGEIIDNLDWGVEFTSRFGMNGLETMFPQASLKYKVTKWFRPSVDYRFISDKGSNLYYTNSHRINLNAEFRYDFDRIFLKSRIRYQYAFDRFKASEYYEPEFDQAIRLKLECKYDINEFILSPLISGELFYDPMYGPFGQQINKIRLFGGVELDLNGPHSISVGYLYDRRINLPNPRIRHILNLSYSYEIGAKKDDSEK